MKLSIIMTLTNRTELLRRTLFALCRWYYFNPKEVELVVVEDIPYDSKLQELLEEYKGFFHRLVLVQMDKSKSAIPVHHNCPALGINLAVKAASYDCIVKLDPECIPVSSIVAEAECLFAKDRLWFFSVLMQPEAEQSAFDLEYQNKMHPEYILSASPTKEWYIDARHQKPYWFGALFSKEKFMEIGGVDEQFLRGFAGEDDDWAERMKRNGVEWCWTDRLKIVHQFHGWANSKYHLSPAHLHNIQLLKKGREENKILANQNYNWGSQDTVVSEQVL